MTTPLQVAYIDWILEQHGKRMFAVCARNGLASSLHHQGNEQAVVTELLRLARIGALAERMAADNPSYGIDELIGLAQRDWDRMQVA